MKRVLVLILAGLISACGKAPESTEPPPPESPAPTATKATPVQNAPKTIPIPIQPLTSAPVVPHTIPIPALAVTPSKTGTATATPAISPTPPSGQPPASPSVATPPPSATGS